MSIRLIIVLFFTSVLVHAQSAADKGLVLPTTAVAVHTVVYQGDTIPFATLPTVVCAADRVFKNHRQKLAWDRLKYNVKKVYPYAILAAAKLKEYDQVLAKMPEQDRSRYMKQAEKQLKDEFGDQLKNLSVSQGRILIKLIDRETGKTTYDVVKSMRGSFSAFMWQGVALVFNSSLKDEYEGDGEDRAIEAAIHMIEDGQL